MTNVETVRVLFHPQRLKIIEALEGEPRTVKQVAAELKIAPTKLYYHVKLLEAHRLIHVVNTRVVSGIIEKQYRVTAHHFVLDPSLYVGDRKNGALQMLLSSIWDKTKRDIRNSVADSSIDLSEKAGRHRSLLIRRHLRRLTTEQALMFYERIQSLLDEFDLTEIDGTDADSSLYSMTVAFYPTRSDAYTKTPALNHRRRAAR